MTSSWQVLLLFGVGLAAGFVDSIAGGGGLITLPVLLNLGLGPQQALATNKLQAVFGSGSAAWHYSAAGTVASRDCIRGFAFTLIGAIAGALAVQQVGPAFLKRFIPVLLIAVATYVILKPKVGSEDIHPRISRAVFEPLFGIILGFYDGFFGPGTGTFWTLAYMLGLGFNMTRATGYTKVMNFASNLGSLALFLMGGKVVYPAGLAMGVGQLLGARLGAKMVVKRGTKLVRPVFLSVVLALATKLIYDNFRK